MAMVIAMTMPMAKLVVVAVAAMMAVGLEDNFSDRKSISCMC